jgi:hypothetical protein
LNTGWRRAARLSSGAGNEGLEGRNEKLTNRIKKGKCWIISPFKLLRQKPLEKFSVSFIKLKRHKGMKKRLQSRMHPCVRYLTKIALLMKMTFGIILLSCLQVAATGYSQEARLTLDMKQVTISKVLKTIELRTDYHFVYSSNLFPANSLVSLSVKEKPVSDILNLVLEKTGFTFRKVDDLIIITTIWTGGSMAGS